MSFEGTTNPVVAETVVSDAPEVEVNDAPETEVSDSPDIDENGEEVSPPAPVDDTEEVDYEGQKVRVPKIVKDSLLRHADYTRKTQELAEQRKAFEATRESSTTVHKDYVDALANIKTYDAQLARYENVDWATLEATDPSAAQSHWRTFSQLKDGRATAEKTATAKQQSLAMESDRARDNRIQEVKAELEKILPEWAPDSDFEKSIAKFGTANSLSKNDIAEATIRNPAWLKIINLARIGADLQTKQANTKRIEAAQAVKPAAEIGSRSATAVKDPAKMSHDAYRKWRASQQG